MDELEEVERNVAQLEKELNDTMDAKFKLEREIKDCGS